MCLPDFAAKEYENEFRYEQFLSVQALSWLARLWDVDQELLGSSPWHVCCKCIVVG